MIVEAPPNRAQFNAFATVFCECGWMMWQAANDTAVCNNQQCGHYGDPFKINVELVRINLEEHLA